MSTRPTVGSVDELINGIQVMVRHRSPLLIALDGRSGAGKTTVAAQLADALNAVVIEADDFFSGGSLATWTNRTPAQRADLCIDWRRLRTEALVPLLDGRTAMWHAFDWDTEFDLVAKPTVVEPADVIILDGAFSSRPELLDLIDYSILIELSAAERDERIRKREGDEFMTKWRPIWSSAEEHYFEHVRPPGVFDAILENT